MKKSIVLFFLALFCFSGYAQPIDPTLRREMEKRKDNEKIKVIVIMKSQYDRSQLQRRADYYGTRAERREFVVNELKQFAEASQYDLRRSLDEMERNGMTTAPKVIWMANALYFSATKQAINDLAMRRDIELIGLDEEKQMQFDEEPRPANPGRGVPANVIQVQANQVWHQGYTGQGVVVAIIDTGVNYNHVDLADHLWDGGPEFPNHGWNFCNNDNDPMDDYGHGTACAGIICGDGTAGCHTGIAPDATLMCVKVGNTLSTEVSLICNGMQWAVEHGADLLSMSLGLYDPSLTERILLRNTCVAVLAAGVVSASAAGNIGNSQMYPVPRNIGVPAGCPPPYMDPVQESNPGGLSCVVCVGAVDADDQAADFTSHGPVTWTNTEFGDYPYTPGSATAFGLIRPDVCAPGVKITSLNRKSTTGYSTGSGTSCSTPCVAGCMALMLSKNDNLTPADLCRILEETAVPLAEGKSNIVGYGRVDALAAVNAVTGNKGNIEFADSSVKEICVSLWDVDGDGELSYFEAGLVDSLKFNFQNTGITSFRELQYFTNVKRIRPGEFANCSNLTEIDIPSSVISIGKAAFDSCFNLAVVTLHTPRRSGLKVPNLYEGVFDGNRGPLTIYVPYGSLDRYKTAPNWENYESMIYPWLQKGVDGYGKHVENGKWAFVASPLAENTAPDENAAHKAIEGMIADTAAHFDLYRFIQSAYAEWENYKSEGDHYHFELENGRGYLYANKKDAELVFKGTFNERTSQEVQLACSGNGDLKGWNLVGNPFPYDAIVADRSFYVMNQAGTGLNPNTASSGLAVPPCTGIFVKAESTETHPIVTFSKRGSGTKVSTINQGLLHIEVAIDTSINTIEDMAVISFNEGDQLGKFYFGENNANIYFPQGNEEYSIVVSEAFGTIPLNFVAKENNRYVLTIIPERVELNYLHLIDNLTGEDVDLLAPSTVIDDENPQSYMPSYTFTAQTTDYASRFRLVLSSRGDENDDNTPFAFIRDGQIILIDGDAGDATLQIVDVTGRILVCRDASNSSPVSITGMASGVYVLRLVNGDDVKTQKIIVP